MKRRTKASRKGAFRAFARQLWWEPEFVFRRTPLSERCYGGRCGGSGWLECWCGFCGEEECFGCSDCRDDGDPHAYDETFWGNEPCDPYQDDGGPDGL